MELLIPGSGFILTLILGFWLSKVGKPYNGILFNAHKLVALATVVVTGLALSRLLTGSEPLAVLISFLGIAAICVVALLTSGALMSVGKLDYAWMRAIHRIAPAALTIALALVFALLPRNL